MGYPGLSPMARQIAARGRLCAGRGWCCDRARPKPPVRSPNGLGDVARIGLRYYANATGVASSVLPIRPWVNPHELTQRRTTVNRNSDCSVVKASIRLGTVRVIGGHHGAAVPRHHRYQYIRPRHVGADPSVYLGCLSWRPSAFSACGVCAIARQPVGARLAVACGVARCSRPARSRCARCLPCPSPARGDGARGRVRRLRAACRRRDAVALDVGRDDAMSASWRTMKEAAN